MAELLCASVSLSVKWGWSWQCPGVVEGSQSPGSDQWAQSWEGGGGPPWRVVRLTGARAGRALEE